MTRLHTVGHGTLSAEAFASLLDGAHVGRVVDIRSFPGSRHNPQYGQQLQAVWPTCGVQFERLQWDLGTRTSVSANVTIVEPLPRMAPEPEASAVSRTSFGLADRCC